MILIGIYGGGYICSKWLCNRSKLTTPPTTFPCTPLSPLQQFFNNGTIPNMEQSLTNVYFLNVLRILYQNLEQSERKFLKCQKTAVLLADSLLAQSYRLETDWLIYW